MKAGELKIIEFLGKHGTTFAIPVYQRNYDWTLAQCKQLLQDIIEAGANNEVFAHFIGSIVHIKDSVYMASELNELTIIDGQQRLTTLTLIYIAIFRLAKELHDEKRMAQIQETYLINKFAPENEKLKLKPTEDNMGALKSILNLTENNFSGFSRIIDNFNFFKKEITKTNFETVLKGIAKLVFVEISLDRSNDNPQRIFESLNSKGLALSESDLIRNYILMGLKSTDQKRIYQTYWEPIEKCARDEITNENHTSSFIRDYLTLINKTIPRKDYVYEAFKAKFPVSTLDELEQNLSGIKSLVYHYNKLLNPQNEPDKDVRLQLQHVRKLEINVVHPFLLKVYDDYVKTVIDKTTFIEVLSLVQSFVWRRSIVDLPTNALNKIFMNIYDKVDATNYLYSIQKYLLQRSGSQHFPRNSDVENKLAIKDVYNMKSKNRSYLFERLENFENNEFVNIDENSDITIEHIFPKNPVAKWKYELGAEEYNLISEKYLNTIGNLTLSGNNGQLGNKWFEEKRDMNVDGQEQGYRFSRLWLNRELKEKRTWNKAEIEKRAEEITKRALKIWTIPEISVEEKIDDDEVSIFDADDATGKKLEYAMFFNQKLPVKNITELYIEVFKQLLELSPETFFSAEFSRIITKDQKSVRAPKPLNDTYFIEANKSNSEKVKFIKKALEALGFDEELFIKYSSKNDGTDES